MIIIYIYITNYSEAFITLALVNILLFGKFRTNEFLHEAYPS